MKYSLNNNWDFHLGEIVEPMKTVRKAFAIGGLAAPLEGEQGPPVILGAGGEHFLKLISQGNIEKGLEELAGTNLNASLGEGWNKVSVPHDWKNSIGYVDNPKLLMSGSKPDGVGYYRKTFKLEEGLEKNKQILLNFMGVMRMASVWFNGVFLGENYSGYTSFEFDITELARYGDEGENVLLVKVDTTTGSEGWWYEGAGIYKDVYLDIHPKIHINKREVYFETKKITSKTAKIRVHVGIENSGYSRVTGKVFINIDSIEEEINFDLPSLTNKIYECDVDLPNVKLWSPEHPYLYKANITLNDTSNTLDELSQKFGVREIKYNNHGFYLNGKLTMLRGVCEHQDFGGVGVAVNRDILKYKLLKMKEMGVNSYRSAHHFASNDLLDLCDELGIIVMNENRILEPSQWRINDLVRMIKESRNHPSICFLSLCNEEVIGNTPLGSRVAKKLTSIVKKLTDSLIVSAELLNPEGIINKKYLETYDVIGVNYPEAAVMGEGLKKIKSNYPDLPLLSTENASYFSTRGIYNDNEMKCQTNNFGSMYSMVLPGKRKQGDPGVGGTARPEEVIAFYKENPFMGGVFLWTFMDYNGEPSPFKWPAVISQFGITDIAGLPKDYFYYYKSKWTAQPMVHIMPHWNKEGLELDENGFVNVRAFSNCREVELFVNECSFGKKIVEDNTVNWKVPYESGTIKVIGYCKNGEVVDQRSTSSKIFSLTVEKIFCSGLTEIFKIVGVDRNGIIVPDAESEVSISIKNGTVVGLANGNPADISDFSIKRKRLFSGEMVVIASKNFHEKEIDISGHLI